MTELLQKAFAEAANLPEVEQDELARNLLEDLAVDGKSDRSALNSVALKVRSRCLTILMIHSRIFQNIWNEAPARHSRFPLVRDRQRQTQRQCSSHN
jgi:hypothetical protein